VSDLVRRFVLERHPIRGHAVRMSGAWQALREHQDYPPAVQQLLGEAIGAVVLLAATLKFDGTLTLQLQGKGLVSLLVAQCTHDFKVRGMARHDSLVKEGGDEAGFRALAGEGQIVVTVEATDRASSYQGVVPITGDSLAESLEAYFLQSEQLPSRVLLAANGGEFPVSQGRGNVAAHGDSLAKGKLRCLRTGSALDVRNRGAIAS
jgi:molecular chaperone Hsp33